MENEVQEQQQTEQEAEAAFLAGFNGEPVEQQQTTPPAKAENSAAAEGEGEQQPTKAADEPAKAEGEGEASKDDEPRIAGFTESELRNLLAGAAEVGTIKEQLRKAHGTIGELKGTLQELRKGQAPARLTPEQKQQIEQANPEVTAYVREHLGDQSERETQAAPQAQAGATDEDIQAALMDLQHEGWKDKVVSQDFTLWLAAQPEETRTTFDKATKAKELGGVISKYDAWKSSREQQQAKGKARLEAAVTPTGNAGKQKAAPTENDAFLAGFKSVMG